MPENSRWDLIQPLKVKIVRNPGNGRLNNLNDPDRPQCVKNMVAKYYSQQRSMESNRTRRYKFRNKKKKI